MTQGPSRTNGTPVRWPCAIATDAGTRLWVNNPSSVFNARKTVREDAPHVSEGRSRSCHHLNIHHVTIKEHPNNSKPHMTHITKKRHSPLNV